MKLFIDTANVEDIRKAAEMGVIQGVTTNPSLIAREGKDFIATVKEITTIVDGPISAEVTATVATEMVKEGKELSSIHPNIVVKIPMTAEGLKATKELSKAGINTNVTLIFSPAQALLAAKAGATYVSPFVGRLDDIGEAGVDLLAEIVNIFDIHGMATEIISASIRNPLAVVQAAGVGCHIATIPFNVIEKMLNHHLTDEGLAKFDADWKKFQSEVKK